MKRILASISFVILLFGSLIAFPAYIGRMVLVWIAIAAVVSHFRGRAWPWLVGVALVLVAKRPGFTFEFFVLLAAIVTLAFLDWRVKEPTNKTSANKRVVYGSLILVAAVTLFEFIRWNKTNPSRTLELDQRPIACLGDSLTDFGYPENLADLISVPIADFGVNGIATDAGIEMIPEILVAQPQLVVIELGGHDYNGYKRSRSETKKNLAYLIESFQAKQIDVILVEIPRGFISDPYDAIERELAAQYDLKLIDDSMIRTLIFNSPVVPPGMWLDPSMRYSNDGLHPNKRGNEFMALNVAKALQEIYGDAVLAQESD